MSAFLRNENIRFFGLSSRSGGIASTSSRSSASAAMLSPMPVRNL